MICYRQKSTICPGKLISSQKTPKNSPYKQHGIWVAWLSEELYAKLLPLDQPLGYPWKLWGITVQTSYVEGRWHWNWACNRQKVFWGAAREMSKKSIFFALWSPARKRREILGWAIKGEKPGIHRGTNAFWAKIGCGAVLTLFWSPNVGRGRQNVIR